MFKLIHHIVFIVALLLLVDPALARDERSIKDLSKALAALAPDVDPAEAEQLSVTAHTTARRLAREYRVVLNPEFTVFLVNMGMRKRGWCGHWAQDIGARLKELKLKTLVLQWGVAYDKTSSENNCIVVTARNQPFQDGIIIDGWRNAGRLFWCPLEKDLAEGRAENPFLQRPPTALHGSAWEEDGLYTTWLQDYKHVYKWQWGAGRWWQYRWQPTVR